MMWLKQLIFLPGELLAVFYKALTGNLSPDGESLKPTPSIFKYVSVICWVWLAYTLYSNFAFSKIYYVYACPDGNTSKCYKVVADYMSGECEDVEYDIRGSSGGSCTDDSFGSITFPNSGYISFDYCDKNSKDKWTCYAEDRSDGVWNLQLAEILKVKK
jgi:hypothetical protein